MSENTFITSSGTYSHSQSIEEWVDILLSKVQKIIISVIVNLGPFFVAAMPASFTGYSVYNIFKEQPVIAFAFALIVGFALEAVGILATHTSVQLYNAFKEDVIEKNKFYIMAWMVPIYIIAVDLVVIYSEAFESLIFGIAFASPWLTVIVYLAIALAADAQLARKQIELARSKAELKEAEQSQHEFARSEAQADRELRREQMQLKHELALKRLELDSANAQAPQKPDGDYECPYGCGDIRPTVQARSAHMAHCQLRPVEINQNGH